MRRLQHKVPRAIDERRLFLGVASPKHEYDGIRFFIHQPHNLIGEPLPAAFAVRGSLAHLDRQHAVQKQYALFGPMFEEPMLRRSDPEIALQFLEDVDEAWRRPGSRRNGEAEAMRLSLTMIRILSQDDNTNLVKRSQNESIEDEVDRWIDDLSLKSKN